jgi:lipoprotein-anchoring transpeptidase ErfK/SrfK
MNEQKLKSGSILTSVLLIVFVLVGVILATPKLFDNKNLGKYDSSKRIASFNGKEYLVPPEIVIPKYLKDALLTDTDDGTDTNILGSSSKKNKEKRIEIDLSEQKLFAYEGDKQKMKFDVSTGKWAETPTGEYRIWSKLKYTLMTGGLKENNTYYYLPNVPYTMYFYQGYGIHGTYWHDNFGHPMSHGCVNMRTSDAEKLFYWANPPLPENSNSINASKNNNGTRVIVYGLTPKE